MVEKLNIHPTAVSVHTLNTHTKQFFMQYAQYTFTSGKTRKRMTADFLLQQDHFAACVASLSGHVGTF
jgi:hypothetical protein